MTKIIAHVNLEDVPHRDVPLWHHTKGLQFTRSGYGRRIPTTHMVQLPGSPRWRRVYCCIFSNSGTCYVPDKSGNWTVIQ